MDKKIAKHTQTIHLTVNREVLEKRGVQAFSEDDGQNIHLSFEIPTSDNRCWQHVNEMLCEAGLDRLEAEAETEKLAARANRRIALEYLS